MKRIAATDRPYVKRYGENDAACEAQKLPWWVWSTTRFANGLTTVAPFWRPIHYVNIATQIRGWWWRVQGY